jgi:hypothetical protein
MVTEVLVNETVNALIRVTPNGDIYPTSFVWRDRTRYVGDIGRQWEERIGGKLLRCYLIQAVDNNTFELYWDPAVNVWTVHRAWLRAAVA